jgi:hypothetical protein
MCTQTQEQKYNWHIISMGDGSLRTINSSSTVTKYDIIIFQCAHFICKKYSKC